jgi:hypothetical protein
MRLAPGPHNIAIYNAAWSRKQDPLERRTNPVKYGDAFLAVIGKDPCKSLKKTVQYRLASMSFAPDSLYYGEPDP